MRLYEYIEQGGVIMYILLVINIIGWAIMLFKFYSISINIKQSEEISDVISEGINRFEKDYDTISIIEIVKQELSSYIVTVEKGLNTVKIIATISPLLGLLGTVLGVLTAFKVMGEGGVGNPAFFAKGISMALITTVGGMIVAIPHFVGHNYLLGLVDKLEVALEHKVFKKVL